MSIERMRPLCFPQIFYMCPSHWSAFLMEPQLTDRQIPQGLHSLSVVTWRHTHTHTDIKTTGYKLAGLNMHYINQGSPKIMLLSVSMYSDPNQTEGFLVRLPNPEQGFVWPLLFYYHSICVVLVLIMSVLIIWAYTITGDTAPHTWL